ncbi:MAG: glycine betaine ABC transporter substrate-binding protein [Burkholderiales bacterium]
MTAFSVCAGDTVTVGSKRFTESYIIGEIAVQRIKASGARAVHRQGLGNTAILFAALKSGAIDVYPDYTGTLAFELLGLKRVPSLADLNAALDVHGLAAGVPLGFSNSYALAMAKALAAELNISSISDLTRHPNLRYGLSQEFLNRKDGWPALRQIYVLPARPIGLDHGLAYEAIQGGTVDAIDVYTTDAKLGRYGLKVLADDRGFFPPYEAVLVYRKDLPQRHPAAFRALQTLERSLSGEAMIRMNAAAELDGQPFARIAADFQSAGAAGAQSTTVARVGWLAQLFAPNFWRLTAEHCLLVFGALALSVGTGVPLGIWAARSRRAQPWILGVTGVLQTIPALALLAFLIAALGKIGMVPAMIALFLYGLLPIVRNTETGLAGIALGMRQAGQALGLRSGAVMRLIELPLALPSVLAGIKTSAVINVSTATIAAFIGAGGYGERIVAGLAVNDHGMMLAGAIPAAALALLIQWTFELLERYFLSYGLRNRAQ